MEPELTVQFAGLKLRSPIIVASGPCSHEPCQIELAMSHGAGAVVLKTVVSDAYAYMRRWPRPRYKLLDWDGKVGGSKFFTLYSFEQGFPNTPHEYAKLIRAGKRLASIPIIASVFAKEPAEWVELAQLCIDAGADAIEVNVSSPHRPPELTIEEAIARIIRAVRDAINVPMIVKLAPSPQVVTHAKFVEELGADAVTLCNRLQGLEVDIETQRPILHRWFAGVGGPWAKFYNMRWVAEAASILSIPISASGGVLNAEDALQYILAGATTVQVLSAIIINGWDVIRDINDGLRHYLMRKGIATVSQICGRVLEHLVKPDEIERWNGGPRARDWMYEPRAESKSVSTDADAHLRNSSVQTEVGAPVANVNIDRCTGCGRCVRVCQFYAMTIVDEKARVDSTRCTGCGLCFDVCTNDAIVWH